MSKKLKTLTKKEHADLWCKVENEGFGYYMMHYGPDLPAIERLGFNLDEVKAAISLMKQIDKRIAEGEEYLEELD